MEPNFDPNKIVLKVLISGIIIVLVVVGLIFFTKNSNKTDLVEPILESEEDFGEKLDFESSVIGTSVEGRIIEAYTYGSGSTHFVFVGGIHGGYEWNSVFLAYRFIDYVNSNPSFIPENITVTVIPSANPDGLHKVTGKDGRFTVEDVSEIETVLVSGRFNSNGIDLNRNFDCKWQPESTWRGNVVSAGAQAFSEPEALAIKNFVLTNKPDAFVFWHSQSNAVYGSECENGILPETLTLMNKYAVAAKYSPIPKFDAYEITGDVEGWLASIGIPAITVELETHESIDWERNLAGIKAILEI